MTIRSVFGAAIGISLVALATAQGQDTRGLRDRTVPLELVEALLTTPRSSLPPSVVVGELPPPMQGNVFVPPGARVIGGSFSSSGATVVLSSSQDVRALESLLHSEHVKLGWKNLPLPGSGGPGGGFRDGSGGGNELMCKAGTALNVQVTQLRAGESRIRLSSDADGICSMMDRAAAQSQMNGDPFAGIRWPVLENPLGVRANFGGCPMTRNFGGMQSAELTTAMKPEELLAHYGKQLSDSGWARAGGETMAQSFTRTDPATGSKLLLRLTAETYDGFPQCRRMSLETGTSR